MIGALLLASCNADCGNAAGILLVHVPMMLLARKLEEARPPPPAPPTVVLGYDVFVADDFIHWHECTDKSTCGHVERSRRFSSLIAMKRVGLATVDGRDVDVIRLEFPAPPSP